METLEYYIENIKKVPFGENYLWIPLQYSTIEEVLEDTRASGWCYSYAQYIIKG